MIYFDNSATGGYKPKCVVDSVNTVINFLCANPGRSGHRLAITGQEIISNCREKLSKMFNAKPERVIFTKNCTESLNLSIKGLPLKGKHVITTVFEHNAVLRPLYSLLKKGEIDLDIVAPFFENDLAEEIEKTINEKTSLIVCTAASNVNGEILPIDKIGKIAKKYNIPFLVDGAQGGGHIPIDMKNQNISMLALAGHKGLYGIMGSGVLILDDSVELSPLLEGGTGTDTFNTQMPDLFPEKLEAGTLNLPAISALLEGIGYLENNMERFSKQLYKNTEKIIEGLEKIDRVKVYSKPNPCGIVAFIIDGLGSQEIADILNDEYDIAVRGGFHCAPLMHEYLKTEKNGLVRVSLSVQNSFNEINFFLHAVERICKN